MDVDPESAARYRGLDGALGDRLRQVLTDTQDGTVMTIEDGRCPMWQQDGLCRIQAELGHDALCKTCREFPRLTHDYGDFVELGLELSCPEAARLILAAPGDLQMHTQPGGTTPEYDKDVMATLRRSRADLLTFLCDPKHSLPDALTATLLYAYSVQEEIDGGEPAPLMPADCLENIWDLPFVGDGNALIAFFQTLEILTPAWASRLQQTPQQIQWSETLRAFAVYLIQRYWLQAIADFDLVCRVKFVLAACLLVGALGSDPAQTAQLFSKEIENDPDNVEAILDAAYNSPALTDANLLGLLRNAAGEQGI